MDLSRCQYKVVRGGARYDEYSQASELHPKGVRYEANDEETFHRGDHLTNRGGKGVWELVKVNGSVVWGQHMQIASQPEAAIYGKPMVYVNFVRSASGNLDDVGASTSGQPQEELEEGSTKCAVS